MQLLEFQAKQVFKEYGITVPAGRLCTTVDDAVRNYDEIGGTVAVKAQIFSGGRGLTGGVKFARNSDEVRNVAGQVFGLEIRGERPGALLLEEKVQTVKELYAAITWDYPNRCPVLIASPRGGMEIESVAKEHPKDIARIRIDTFEGYSDYHGRSLAVKIGLVDGEVTQYARMMSVLWEIFVSHDAELAEINPLGVLQDGTTVALDAKLNIDDKSLQRQKAALDKIGPVPTAPSEGLEYRRAEAKKRGIPTYIEMQGNIGVVADGAGSGMLTLDLVSESGGRTRVYSEMGGEITPELMENTLAMIAQVEGVSVVLINLIGGLNRMDEMAIGISNYFAKQRTRNPIIVRMSGTKQEEGYEILTKNGIDFCNGLDEAVERAVKASRGG
jgi:succinyl-CoA synthetase beta subunit